MSASSNFATKYAKPATTAPTGKQAPTGGSASANFVNAVKAGQIKAVPVAPTPTAPPKENVFDKIGNFLTTAFKSVDPKTEALKKLQTPTPTVDIKAPIGTLPPVNTAPEANQSATMVQKPVSTPVVPPVTTPQPTAPIDQYNADQFKGQTISQAPPKTFWQKVSDNLMGLFESPEDKVARDQDIYAMQKVLEQKTGAKVPMEYVNKNFDELTKELGIRDTATPKELAQDAMAVAIIGGLITNPVSTIVGLAGFTAYGKVKEVGVSKIKPGATTFTDLLPETLPDPLLRTIGAVEFIGDIVLLHKIGLQAPKVKEMLTRDIIQKLDVKPIELSPAQVTDIFQTGKLTTAEQKAIFGSVNTAEVAKKAMKEGITITPEKLLEIRDKPYWEKLKSVFGIQENALAKLKVNQTATETAQNNLNTAVERVKAELTANPNNKGANSEELGKMISADSEVQMYGKELAKLKSEARSLENLAGKVEVKKTAGDYKIGGKETKIETPVTDVKSIGDGSQPVPEMPPVETPVVPEKTLPTKQELTSSKEQLITTLVNEKLAGNDQFTTKMIDKASISPEHLKALEEAIVEADKRVAKIQGETPKEIIEPKITDQNGVEIKRELPNKKSITTPIDAAKDLIREYVLRGDTIGQMRSGGLGVSGGGNSASIGGYLNGKKISNENIIVEKLNGKVVNEVFPLKRIFEEIKNEKQPKTPVKKEMTSPNALETTKTEPPVTEQPTKQAQTVVTDPIRVEEIKSSIAEGKGYLESGKAPDGHKLTPEEIKMYEKSIKSDESKLGLNQSPSVPAGAMASAGSDTVGNFENRNPKTTAADFKLYKKVGELIDKYAARVGEGYLPKKAAGVFYSGTKNIRLNSMNDLSVATHEISHFLDDAYKISDRLLERTPDTRKLRKEITDLYTRYYPGGKKTHKLSLRVTEGLATLIQKYAEQPTTISNEYPNLVTDFLTENGKFYEPVIGEILKDVGQFISDYQGLDPLDKIGARVTSDNVVYDKKSFLSLGDKVRTQLADTVFPIEKLADITGTQMTINDPSLYIRQFQQISGIVATNLIGDKGYY
ncbi:MAG: hypothetical protein WA019_00705, partial [Candidatus Moraniibacteriota bacterium]